MDTPDLAAELRPLLLGRLARTLEHLARELPGGETLPDEAARARLADWQKKRLEVLELFANAQGNAGPRVDASLYTTAADLNGWLLVDEADALRPKRRGEGEGTPLRVAELVELVEQGAADLVEINALALADLAQGLHLPWLAVDAAAAWPWTAARPDGWAIYGRAMMALHAPERSQALTDTAAHRERAQLTCWALRVLLRWAWARSGAASPAGLLPEEELATVGWSPGLDFQTVHRWTDKRVGEAPFPYWMDLLPENTQLGSGTQPFGWLIPKTTPATGIIAFYAAWLASPETQAWQTMGELAATEKGVVLPAHLALARLALAGQEGNEEDSRSLARTLADELRQARKALELDGEAPPAPGARELDGCPGLLWLDELGARHLEKLGPVGMSQAGELRTGARKRWRKRRDTRTLWRLWLPDKTGAPPFVQELAKVLRDRPPSAMVRTVTVKGADYTTLDRVGASIAWSYGAPGVLIESLELELPRGIETLPGVTVDEQRYTAQPAKQGRYASRSYLLLSTPGHKVPGTRQLDLTLPDEEEDEEDLALTVAAVNQATLGRGGRGGELISSTAGKVSLLMLATARPGGLVCSPLRSVTETVYPAGTRLERGAGKHYAEVTKALLLNKWMHLICGNVTIPVFEVATPLDRENPDPDALVSWALTQRFRNELRSPLLPAGAFLVNWSGLLGLGPKQGAELRAYVRAADMWNRSRVPAGKHAGRLTADHIPTVRLANWAAMVNELSGPAAANVAGTLRNAGARTARKDGVRRALEALEALEARKLVGKVDVQGQRDRRIKILPPEALEEAYRAFRKGEAARTDRGGGAK